MTTDHEEQIGKLRLELRDMEADIRKEFIDEVRLIRDDYNKIKDNHLAHIQSSISALEVNQKAISTNLDWLMQNHRWVMGSSIGALVAGVFGILLH